MFTSRNAVLLALTQVGVIVIGTLAAAVSSKVWMTSGLELPFATFLLLNFGIAFFALPLAWISVAITVRQKEALSDDLKHLVFVLGMVLLVALIVFELYAIFRPWLSVFGAGFNQPAMEVE